MKDGYFPFFGMILSYVENLDGNIIWDEFYVFSCLRSYNLWVYS